ncbi:MAG: DinB family protein [Chloroflexota bacterium]
MSLAVLLAPNERNTRPICGSWTLKDVVGHLTVYELMGVTALKDLMEGHSPKFTKTIRNFEAFDEAQVVAKQGIDWSQALSEYRTVRKALVALVDNLSDEQPMRPFVAPWGSPITGYQYVFGLAIHEQEHAAILRCYTFTLPKRLRHYREA